MITGVKLVECKLTPLQAAFIEWCRRHPYSRIKELKIHEGVPLEARVATDDGFGEEVVRFDRIAKEAGLLNGG
jgi:hypothetical protein